MNKELSGIIDAFLTWNQTMPLLLDDSDVVQIINRIFDLDFVSLYDVETSVIANLFFFETDERTFKVEKTREIIEKASIKSSWDFKVFVIKEIDKLTEQASNSLLKLFEDVPSDTLFLLTTWAKENLLETIRSRVLLFSSNSAETTINPEVERLIDEYFSWEKIDFIKFMHSDKLSKWEYLSILEYMVKYIKDWTIKNPQMISLISDSIKDIHSTNVNPRWIIDRIIFSLD